MDRAMDLTSRAGRCGWGVTHRSALLLKTKDSVVAAPPYTPERVSATRFMASSRARAIISSPDSRRMTNGSLPAGFVTHR